MPLSTSVPASLKQPNSFHTFQHVRAGGGLVALPLRVLLVGVKSAAGTATAETPVQVFDLADAITKFGQGSELALMCAIAFAQGNLNGSSGRGGMPELWACPIAAPGASVAAAQTLTVTVTTAVAGTLHVRIAGRDIFVGVSAGDAQNTIAAALEDAIDALARELPVTAGVAGNVVTCTHVTTGTNGNDVAYEVVSAPSGVSVASAQSVAGTGTVDITAALDAAVDKNYDAIAVSIHSGTAVSDAAAHLSAMWNFAQKFWRWVFIGDKATLSTAQGYATSADSEKIIVVSYEGSPSLPSEIATAAAVAAFGVERPNANYDGVEIALYPPANSLVYTSAEIESALAGGVTPLIPTTGGASSQIVRLVTTKITEASAPFYALADLAFSRTLAYRATQYDVQYRQRFQQEVIDGDLDDPEATLLARVRDMCVEIDRAMGDAKYLRDVEDLIAQIQVEEAASPSGRLLVQAPCRVAGPLHQVAFDHLHYYL
jgi:phage tail sheath gpL-like